jgi:hypothetical protein
VLVEYGWALKSLGYGRIVPVMNIAHGDPIADAMPFNMRHLRNPIAYQCPDDLDDSARKDVRDRLATEVEAAIRAVFDSDVFKESLPKIPSKANCALTWMSGPARSARQQPEISSLT